VNTNILQDTLNLVPGLFEQLSYS